MIVILMDIFLFTIYLNTVTTNITTYYLAPDCGQTIDLIDTGGILLKLIAGKVLPEMKCYRLITSSKVGTRLMLYFKDINIAWSQNCTMDWLELHDGKVQSSPYVSGFAGNLCGNSINSTVRTTTGSDLFILFRSGKSVLTKGFDLIITQYHTGQCLKGEYTCNNGRCISDSLVFDGYNPCGDHSDCAQTTTTASTTRPTTTRTTITKTPTSTAKSTTASTTAYTISTTITKTTTTPTSKTALTQTTLPTTSTKPGYIHKHLSGGDIIAIVFGSFTFICILACSIMYCRRRHRRLNRINYRPVG